MSIVTYGVKALAAFSLLFALLAIVTSCWTFGSMIVYHNHFEMRRSNDENLNRKTFEPTSELPKIWAKLENISKRFKNLMYSCIWISNVFILAQITASLFILCRRSTRSWSVSKYFVGIHFLVFLVLLCCLFIPLSEDRKRNIQHSVTTFNDYIMDEFDTFSSKGISYIVQDFNAYYFALGSNIIIIFICMIIACCLLRFETGRPYESV